MAEGCIDITFSCFQSKNQSEAMYACLTEQQPPDHRGLLLWLNQTPPFRWVAPLGHMGGQQADDPHEYE